MKWKVYYVSWGRGFPGNIVNFGNFPFCLLPFKFPLLPPFIPFPSLSTVHVSYIVTRGRTF